MPLLGQAAMLLGFDIVEASVDEHDDWHTHEHMPERLGIPGFLRGSRWTAVRGGPAYAVLYEVANLDVLTSAPYLARLNAPTPWTARVMPSYRNMSRGLCSVQASHGHGLGGYALLLRLRAVGAAAAIPPSFNDWLAQLVMRRGLSSAHLLLGAVQAPMTQEQSIRGADRGVGAALLVTAYDERALDALEGGEARPLALAQATAAFSAENATVARYRLSHSLQAL